MEQLSFSSFRLPRLAGSPASAEPSGRVGELERSARCNWLIHHGWFHLAMFDFHGEEHEFAGKFRLQNLCFAWVDLICLYQKRWHSKWGKLEPFVCWFDLQSTLWPSDWGSLDRWFISWWASHDSRFQVCLNVIFPYFPLETTIGISLKNWTITMALEAFDGKMKASNHKFHTLDDLWQSISSHAPKTTKQNHHSMIFLYNIVYISLYIYNI